MSRAVRGDKKKWYEIKIRRGNKGRNRCGRKRKVRRE
jgi:hypothetical protein